MSRVLFAAVLITVAAFAAAQEAVSLGLQLKAGDVLPLRVVTRQEISQAILGAKRSVTQEIVYRYAIAVDRVESDGIMAATATIEEAAIHRDMADEVAGDEPMAPAVMADAAARGRLYDALKGQRFGLRLTPRGEVLEVTGTDAIVARLTEVLEPSGDEEKKLTEQSLREQFGDQAMREALERLLAVFPDKPVAVGESWERTQAFTKGFPLIVKSTYTLKSIDGVVAVIEEKADVVSDKKPIANPPGSGTSSYSVTGGQAGTITVARDTGWLQSGVYNLQAYGHIAYDTGSDQRHTAVPLSIKTQINIGEPAR